MMRGAGTRGGFARVAILAAVAGGLISCTSAPLQPSAVRADVVVTDLTRPVAVVVGQTLGIQPPSAGDGTWQVDFDEDALKMLTPADKVSAPGERGWVWRALAPAHAEIVLTYRVPCPAPPCAGNPPRLTVAVDITARQ